MAQVPADLRVCIFDVFGTVVDWRGSLIQDLPGLGKKYGMDTDWTSFADDWRGLYQPQMHRVRKGELPWTNIDELHKEAFEMLLAKRGLKHPGEEGSWEFTRLWHKLRPWPDSVEGIGMMKKKYVVATLSNGALRIIVANDLAAEAMDDLPDAAHVGGIGAALLAGPLCLLGVPNRLGVDRLRPRRAPLPDPVGGEVHDDSERDGRSGHGREAVPRS